MPGERTAEQIQQDIEHARVALAVAVDQLAVKASPKRLVDQAKQVLREKAQTPAGKAVLGGVGVLFVVVVIRRIRKH